MKTVILAACLAIAVAQDCAQKLEQAGACLWGDADHGDEQRLTTYIGIRECLSASKCQHLDRMGMVPVKQCVVGIINSMVLPMLEQCAANKGFTIPKDLVEAVKMGPESHDVLDAIAPFWLHANIKMIAGGRLARALRPRCKRFKKNKKFQEKVGNCVRDVFKNAKESPQSEEHSDDNQACTTKLAGCEPEEEKLRENLHSCVASLLEDQNKLHAVAEDLEKCVKSVNITLPPHDHADHEDKLPPLLQAALLPITGKGEGHDDNHEDEHGEHDSHKDHNGHEDHESHEDHDSHEDGHDHDDHGHDDHDDDHDGDD